MKLDEGYNSDTEITRNSIEKDAIKFKTKYFVEKLLHNSANGLIYTGYSKIDGKNVCIKQISRATVPEFCAYKDQEIPREFQLHIKAAANQDCVVQVYDWFERATSFVLVMEYPTDYIDMFEFSRQYGQLNEGPAAAIMLKIIKIVERLAQSGIFHRDLKDENILIHPSTLDVKLIDFGCATDWDQDRTYTELSGTPEFMAPEALKCRKYKAEGASIWSLGVISFILLHGYLPTEISDFKFRSDLSDAAKTFLHDLLEIEPSQRSTLEAARNSTWIQTHA